MIQYEIRKNAYYDSVTLMLISKEIKNIEGVGDAIVGMGTDLNKELTVNIGLKHTLLDAISPNDFYIAAEVDSDESMKEVIESVERLLTAKKTAAGSDYRPATLNSAVEHFKEANLVIVSIAGQYAEEEVLNALDHDLNVMLFSDNVSIEAELRMKQKAVSKELLMMGPDCGTAIINGIPLAFANVVKKGPIGVVGASGTGTQEVTALIDQLGSGCSQVIGTGGRDLKSEIGGLMMLQSIDALIEDPETKVIVLISKPPAPEVAEKILQKVKLTSKPVVVDFIGGNQETIKNAGAYACLTLEDTARKAVALANGMEPVDFIGFTEDESVIDELVQKSLEGIKPTQTNLRALYTGGTLADEAMKLLGNTFGGIYSNIPLSPEYELQNLNNLKGHVCLDLGEDQFTVGRPHPMIDPSTRTDRFKTDIDETVAVVLMDVVIGYGSHENPALEAAQSVNALRASYDEKFVVVASITGTEGDPQILSVSKATLEQEGILVLPSNAQAVRFVHKLLTALGGMKHA
ncbi:acyl-CoA synthetase FdrA [Fusibacter sp. 3D3]|uniref:acyl-CoA synthetase FdrA n=1 Tax=Fusibacter sp. 3D3 TaxID=1048380 RepID=UPI000858F286|nr:acyl-CoA synthetase FdrA [Fusibacter sp. 3D3]GAU77093.1 putative oxidoreductase subunit [Fusibacter sp. 3D3]